MMGVKVLLSKFLSAFNIRNIVIFAMPISMAVLIIMLYNFSQTVEHLSHELIKRTINKTQMELTEFFDPVVANLVITRDLGLSGAYNQLEVKTLNPLFIPFVKNSKQVSSMLLANEKGEEFMLLEEGKYWQNRFTHWPNATKEVVRYRWYYDKFLNDSLMEYWQNTDDADNNPVGKTWFQNAIHYNHPKLPAWTHPYSFKTTKEPGITASMAWFSQKMNCNYVAAFDVLLTDISKYTSNLVISEHGKALVFTQDNMVVGLPSDPRFLILDSIKKYVLRPIDSIGLPAFNLAFSNWLTAEKLLNKPFKFKHNSGDWWCGVEKFVLNEHQIFYIAVIVPEADFLAEINRTRIVIIAGFLLVIVLTLLVIKGYNQKRRDNDLLRKQKMEIERQRDEIEKQRDIVTRQKDQIDKIHKELQSSIHYAQRIQNAIMPDIQTLNAILPNHFVFYRPHSVVSGDFYWATKWGDKLVFAAADCTGHGVPGAFMSMLGISFLNEIVGSNASLNAGQILNILREKVIDALKQNSDNVQLTKEMGLKDGMDISLSVFDPASKILQFAGANNPLYLVRNKSISPVFFDDISPDISTQELDFYEFKADKMPIAIYDRMAPFKTHFIPIQNGDRIFMFSDGFIDQFGGNEGKKFKSKPFKDLIISSSTYPLSVQKLVIENEFVQWISAFDDNDLPYHQTDDVVVFAVAFV